jgi:Fe-S-cluster containining protein
MPEFYADGLQFSCRKCSDCCRLDPGYVFLSQQDADRLAFAAGLSYINFIEVYCRWVPCGDGRELLSLKEKTNFDCILWGDGGCGFYEERPLQCKTFPFWKSSLSNKDTWDSQASTCPGMNNGELHCKEEIESTSALHEAESIISRSNTKT